MNRFIDRVTRQVALASLLLCGALAAHAQADTPVGVWQTIDDHTGQPKALVQISADANGDLSGKVIKGLGANDQPTGAARRAPIRARINRSLA